MRFRHPFLLLFLLSLGMNSALAEGHFVYYGHSAASQAAFFDIRLVTTISKSDLDSLRHARHVPRRLAPVRYDVAVYDVLYKTSWVDGTQITASGFLLVPEGATDSLPILSYNHGTRLKKDKQWALTGEEAICSFYAADGYVVCMPDYVGLRKGEKNHLYHHSKTEALASVDMIRATKTWMADHGKNWSKQLFLTGYSQGGHAAMATHKYIQENLASEMTVTASAPMSGAYDLAGVQGKVLNETYEQPGYLPYLLFSYQAAYQLGPDSSAFFQPPYDTLLPKLFNGQNGFKEVNPYLPPVPAQMLKPALLQGYTADASHPLKLVMEENSLVDWAPEAPVLLCYCKQDEQVKYQNSLVAYDHMVYLGSESVTKRMAGRKFRHGPCSIFTNIYARMWFDSIRKGHPTGKKGPLWNRFLVQMSKLAIPKK